MPSLAGTRIDKYEMLEEVGHGGMAVVYRGQDSVLEREVAVKVLHPHLADREESRQRLRREALAVAKLRHENILEIFDYSGAEAAESYIVTEFIHGPTLREWIDETLDPRPAIAALIVHRLCLALHHAHKGGIVHRDIKPENVMIRSEDGCLKLMDFGIAQILDNQKLTLTGQLIGSPAYMAPELISGRPLDQRTDLFSLGILLYQLSTGELPFAGRNPHEVLNRIADGDYPAPSTICPLVDRDLEAIIAAALATNPEDRYQTVEAFAKELEQYLEEMGVPPSPVELKGYFRNPKSYVAQLDERVSKALMEKAQAVARQGHTARAIALLGRVLELDNNHKEARALLDRLRRQERRMRQLLVGAGSVAAVGLVAAGVVLVPPEPVPKAEQLTVEAHRPKDRPSQPPVKPPAAVREDAPPAPPLEDDAVEEPGPDEEPAVAGKKKNGKGGPKRVDTSKKDEPVTCMVRVTEIPPSVVRNFAIQAQGETFELPESGVVEITLERDSALASIRTNDQFRGSVTLTREKCNRGTVALPARRKAAYVKFNGLPDGAVVQCKEGCPEGYAKDFQEPGNMRPFPMDQRFREVTFYIKADGHLPKSVHKSLSSGSNLVKVALKPREN